MRLLHLLSVVSCGALVLGCPKKGGDADASADADVVEAGAPAAVADAAPAAPPVVNAKNSADVARFPAETPVTDDDAKLLQPAPARTSPRSGTVVATIKPASDVTKIAEYQNSYLVTFSDPKDASVTLMGWIGKESFSARTIVRTDPGAKVDAGAVVVVDAGAAKVTCAAGQVAVVLTKDPVCKKKCAKDADCKSGCATASSQTGGVARVCANDP